MSDPTYNYIYNSPHSSEIDTSNAQGENTQSDLWWYIHLNMNEIMSYSEYVDIVNKYQPTLAHNTTSELDGNVLITQMADMNIDIMPAPHNIGAYPPANHENNHWPTSGGQLAGSDPVRSEAIVDSDQTVGEYPPSMNSDPPNLPHAPVVQMEYQFFPGIPETRYPCFWPDCNKIFTSKYRASTHYNNFHALASGWERVLYTCDQCGEYTTPYESAIPRHKKSQRCISNRIRRQLFDRI